MEHGFPGGPPRPPSGPPLRDEPSSSASNDHHGLPPGPPRGEPLPPAQAEPDGPATEDLPQPAPPSRGDDGTPAASRVDREHADLGAADPDPAPDVDADEAAPTFAEVLAAQREQGRHATPPPPPPSAPPPAPPDPAPPSNAPPPPAGSYQTDGATPDAPTWEQRQAVASGGLSLRRVGRWARNLAVGGLAAVGLLGVIGLLMNDEVEGGDEGAFAQVPVDTCRDLELESPPATFAAGTDPTVEVDGNGIGDPQWQARLPEPLDGRIEHIPGDDSETITLVMTVLDEDGAPTAHSVSYDLASGEVQGQLHLDAELQAAAGTTQWYAGTRGRSSLLFPVVDQQITACFAASPRPGSPTPPLAVEIEGNLQPLPPDSGQLAVTEDAALVLLRVDDTRPVQRLGLDGAVSRTEIGDVVSIHAARDAFHVLVGTSDQAQLVALDPDSLDERWTSPFPTDLVFEIPRLAATDVTLSVTAGLRDDGELHRFGVADGQPRGDVSHGLDRPLLAADGTTTYVVDSTPGDGTEPARVLRLPEEGADLEDIDTPALQPGLRPVATTPTSVVLGARWEEDGAGGLLLRDGDVFASAAAPFLAVGTDHVLALTFAQGEMLLVGLPLDAEPADGGDDGDDAPEDGDAAADADAGDADDPTDESDDPSGDDPDDPAEGDGPSGAGDGGGGGGEVTDNADIEEEWLP